MTKHIVSYTEAVAANPTWFSRDSKAVFGCRISRSMYPTKHGAYFVSSARAKRGEERRYMIHFIDATTGKVVDVTDFRHYQTNYGAQLGAKTRAETYAAGCTVCRHVGHSPAEACQP